jgi:hypothetical protein
MKSLERIYDRLKPTERVSASFEAFARDDDAEVKRLRETDSVYLSNAIAEQHNAVLDLFVRTWSEVLLAAPVLQQLRMIQVCQAHSVLMVIDSDDENSSKLAVTIGDTLSEVRNQLHVKARCSWEALDRFLQEEVGVDALTVAHGIGGMDREAVEAYVGQILEDPLRPLKEEDIVEHVELLRAIWRKVTREE